MLQGVSIIDQSCGRRKLRPHTHIHQLDQQIADLHKISSHIDYMLGCCLKVVSY
jgi:hypothetical protein